MSLRTPPVLNHHNNTRKDALKRLSSGVTIKNRRYRFRMYKNCFVGSEAIDYMVQSGWAKSREEAVIIGQKLQRDHHLFCHVCGDHLFSDAYLFYRFIAEGDDDSSSSILAESRSSTTSSISHRRSSGMLSVNTAADDDPHMRHSWSECLVKKGLLYVGEILRHDVQLYYKYSVDKECFTANEAIDHMVMSGLASSQMDAIQIGRALQREGVIESVDDKNKGGPYVFKDARLFYSFTTSSSSSSSSDNNHDHNNNNNNNNTSDWEEDLGMIGKVLLNNVPVDRRTYHLKVYDNSFVGRQAVDILLEHTITSSRRDAVLLGRAIMHEYQLFEHVTCDRTFEDEDYFYKFVKQSEETTNILEAFRHRADRKT